MAALIVAGTAFGNMSPETAKELAPAIMMVAVAFASMGIVWAATRTGEK